MNYMKNRLNIVIFAFFCINGAYSQDTDSWNFNWGMDDRFRYEYKSNYDFDDSVDDDGSVFYNRLKINGKALWNEQIELFAEGLDGRVWVDDLSKPSQEDEFDLHQAYVNFKSILEMPLDIKFGRQELKYGKGRLITASGWSNKIAAFDALLLHYKTEEQFLDLFYGQNVVYEESEFNDSDSDLILKGIYYSYQQDKDASLYEAYYLEYENTSGVYDNIRKTAGTRFILNNLFNNYVPEVEIAYQSGEENLKDIKGAYAVHVDLTRQFSAELNPKLMIEYNFAKGDKDYNDDETNTFNPLFQVTHDQYGLTDFFRWQNMQEVASSLCLETENKIKFISGLSFLWLENANDFWYNSSGAKLRRDREGDADEFAGFELSFVTKYDVTDKIKVDGGIARLFTGDYISDTGPDDDPLWIYGQINLKV